MRGFPLAYIGLTGRRPHTNSVKEVAVRDVMQLAEPQGFRRSPRVSIDVIVPGADSGVPGGAIPVKYRELMALAAALTTRCPRCIELHTRRARRAGATELELTEATLAAATVQGDSRCLHGRRALE